MSLLPVTIAAATKEKAVRYPLPNRKLFQPLYSRLTDEKDGEQHEETMKNDEPQRRTKNDDCGLLKKAKEDRCATAERCICARIDRRRRKAGSPVLPLLSLTTTTRTTRKSSWRNGRLQRREDHGGGRSSLWGRAAAKLADDATIDVVALGGGRLQSLKSTGVFDRRPTSPSDVSSTAVERRPPTATSCCLRLRRATAHHHIVATCRCCLTDQPPSTRPLSPNSSEAAVVERPQRPDDSVMFIPFAMTSPPAV